MRWWDGGHICFSLIIPVERRGRDKSQSASDTFMCAANSRENLKSGNTSTRLMLGGYKPAAPDPSRPPSVPDNVRRLPLSQTAPQAAARLALPQAAIPVLANRIPLLLLLLLHNRLRGRLPVRADRNPTQPLHLGHQCRRVPCHPLLAGHHPYSLRHERHRPHPNHPPHPQTPSTPPRHTVRRARRVPAEHHRLPHRRAAGQERQSARSLCEGRQQERERHFGVPHSQVRLDDGPGCKLRAVQTNERAAESWLHQPTRRIRQVPEPITIIAPPPPTSKIRPVAQPSGPSSHLLFSSTPRTSDSALSLPTRCFVPHPTCDLLPTPFRTLHRTASPYPRHLSHPKS